MTEKRYKADCTLKQIAKRIYNIRMEIEQAKVTYASAKLPSVSNFSGVSISNGRKADSTGETVLLREQTEKRIIALSKEIDELHGLFFGLLKYCDKDSAEIIKAYYLERKKILNISIESYFSVDTCNRKLASGRDAVYKRMVELLHPENEY